VRPFHALIRRPESPMRSHRPARCAQRLAAASILATAGLAAAAPPVLASPARAAATQNQPAMAGGPGRGADQRPLRRLPGRSRQQDCQRHRPETGRLLRAGG